MHDIRSPLMAVSNATDAMMAMPESTFLSNKDVQEMLRTLHTSSRVMHHIMSDMLDFERIDCGRMQMVPGDCRLADLLDAVHSTFAPLAAKRGIDLLIEPPSSSLCFLVFQADQKRVEQCLFNGVSNACKFTEKGGRVCVRALEWPDDGELLAPISQQPSGIATLAEQRQMVASKDASGSTLVEAKAGLAAEAELAAEGTTPPGDVQLGVRAFKLEVSDTGCGLSSAELAILNDGGPFSQVRSTADALLFVRGRMAFAKSPRLVNV